MLVAVAPLLEQHPRQMKRRAKEAIALAHYDWVREVERVQNHLARTRRIVSIPISKAADGWLRTVDHERLADIAAELTAGDRGLSRVTEDRVPSTVRQAMDRRVRTIMARLDRIGDLADSRARAAHARLRARVTALAKRLADGEGNLTKTQIKEIDRAITKELRIFEDKLIAEYGGVLRRANGLGVAMADVPVDMLGLTRDRVPPPPDLESEDLFRTLKDRLAGDQQRKLTDQLNKIRRGTTSGSVGVAKIQQIIDEPLHSAQRIMRTESGRAASTAFQGRLEEHGRLLKKLKKGWASVRAHNSRKAHIAAHYRYSEERAIVVDKPFVVWGEELMQPRIGGSARNVCNCLCSSFPVAKDAEVDTKELRAA